MKVRFIAQAPEQFTGELRFAVTVCRHEEKWVYCQHRQRESFEIPGGHIEPGESPEQAARRELYEETGALNYTLQPVGVYGVEKDGVEDFGALYFAQIHSFGPLPEQFEMRRICLCEQMPQPQTYPLIQPKLLEWVQQFLLKQTIPE